MNPRIPALVVLLALAGVVIFFVAPRGEQPASIQPTGEPARNGSAQHHPPSQPQKATPNAPDPLHPERAQPAEISASGVAIFPRAAELLPDFNNPETPPEHDLELLEVAFSKYRQVFGHNPPGGTNAEIMSSLTGQNSKELAIVPPDFPEVNTEGEIIDRWGTPYMFHPVSRQVMEVLSAGPDGLLWTEDDIGSITPAGQVGQPD